MQAYLPFYFKGWARNASINIPPRPFLNGKVDLFPMLTSISRRSIVRMQTVLSNNAQKLTYGLDQVHGDALDMLLEQVGPAPSK